MFSSRPFLLMVALMGMTQTFNGDATYFFPGMGACGWTSQDADLIVALSVSQYGDGGHCGHPIGVHYQGKYVQVTVVDKCEGCRDGDIDLSPSAFSQLADQSLGRIQVSWDYL